MKFLFDKATYNNNGIGRRMLTSVILFSTCITAFMTVFELYRDYRGGLSDIEQSIKFIQTAHVNALTESVWVFDELQSQSHLESMTHISDIEFAGVKINNEYRWISGMVRAENQLAQQFELARDYRGKTINIGTLYIVASVDRIYNRLWSKALQVLISNGIKTFLVALFMLILFQFLVGRHLEHIARYLQQFGNDSRISEKLQLQRASTGLWRPDALDHVTTAMNKMHTQLSEAQYALTTMNSSLEKRVKERTKELEASNKELTSFSYSVSHDLRSPLRTLDGFSKILLDDYAKNLDNLGKDYLRRIREAAQHMGHVTDDLLSLANISKQDLELTDTNLSSIAEDTLKQLRHSNPERKVEASIQPDIHLIADEGLLKILIENLMNNAWKYTSKNTQARIDIGTHKQGENKIFYVRDNGVGFDMQYADKLFNPFERLHSGADFPGSGIGLATVHRIIKRLNGQIWAESNLGRGSVFYFTINQVDRNDLKQASSSSQY